VTERLGSYNNESVTEINLAYAKPAASLSDENLLTLFTHFTYNAVT